MAGSFFVGVCRIEISLPTAQSLKDRRAILQSVTARMRREFSVSVADLDAQPHYGRAVLGLAAVSNQASHARDVVETAARFLENTRLDAEIETIEFDVLPAW